MGTFKSEWFWSTRRSHCGGNRLEKCCIHKSSRSNYFLPCSSLPSLSSPLTQYVSPNSSHLWRSKKCIYLYHPWFLCLTSLTWSGEMCRQTDQHVALCKKMRACECVNLWLCVYKLCFKQQLQSQGDTNTHTQSQSSLKHKAKSTGGFCLICISWALRLFPCNLQKSYKRKAHASLQGRTLMLPETCPRL